MLSKTALTSRDDARQKIDMRPRWGAKLRKSRIASTQPAFSFIDLQRNPAVFEAACELADRIALPAERTVSAGFSSPDIPGE